MSIRARHEGGIEEGVVGDLDVWDAMMLVHEVRLREARFKELEGEEGDCGSFVSVGDSERSWEEEMEETEEEMEARVWEGLRRELREAYEVLMEGCKCLGRNCGSRES